MSLKVFDLQCENGHVFEGWFASADAYDSQKSQGLLSCPVCNSSDVTRKLSAARLNVGHLKRERLAPTGEVPADPRAFSGAAVSGSSGANTAGMAAAAQAQSPDVAQIQAEIIRRVRQMVRDTENVGNRFADESRRMHRGEAEERPIRGTATAQERAELADEGIAVLAIPEFLDDDRLQ